MKPSKLHIANHLLPGPNAPLFLGVSGGLDSIALLHTSVEQGFKPTALHVNYRLRGEQADMDEAFVRSVCNSLGVQVKVYRVSDSELADMENGNLQAKARDIRYRFFADNIGQKGTLMTAHHSDDQVETFFMRLFRKSGIVGLQAIHEKKGRIIRPFLHVSKEEIREVALQKGWKWREDASNQSTKYLRNQLRLEWLPMMEKEIPDLRQSALHIISAFQSQDQIYRDRYQKNIDDILAREFWPFTSFDQVNQHVLYWLGHQLHFTASEIDQLKANRTAENSSQIKTNHWGTVLKTRKGWQMKTRHSIGRPRLSIESVETLPSDFSKHTLYLDPQKLNGELVLRQPNIGDRIFPKGMNGSQLVSKILKDAKLEQYDKEECWLLCDNSDIHWVYGLKVGKKAIAQPDSKEIWKVELKFSE
ncbi:MAG: tRNA lysidine(34) synthetase TilS [Crocinitomicaceae bacterium]|jgi:tRNA(Ile)-lysidine synthase|nr:tRNA lysidine(34) synthetase TilS [Crocinitomicaceae bacterium]